MDSNILQCCCLSMSATFSWPISLDLCRLFLNHIWQVVSSTLALCLEILLLLAFHSSTYICFNSFCSFVFLVNFSPFLPFMLSKFSDFFLLICSLIMLFIMLIISAFYLQSDSFSELQTQTPDAWWNCLGSYKESIKLRPKVTEERVSKLPLPYS